METHICSKHFVHGKPTDEFPNPSAAVIVSNPYSRWSNPTREQMGGCRKAPKRRRRCDFEEGSSSGPSVPSNLEKNQQCVGATDSAVPSPELLTGMVLQAVSGAGPVPVERTRSVSTEDHLYCRTTVQKQNHSVKSSLSPVSPQELISCLLNGQSMGSSLQVVTSGNSVGAEPVYVLRLPDHLYIKPAVASSPGVKMSSTQPALQRPNVLPAKSPDQCSDHCGKEQLKLPVENQPGCVCCSGGFTSQGLEKPQRKDKPYQCEQCGKMMSTISDLKNHLTIHTGEKPYRCEQCGKCFRQPSSLRSHKKVHSGERPFQCDQCGKCFGFGQNLRTHLRIHTGERPYICHLCGERFSSSVTLKSHRRSHTREKLYRCRRCGECFGALAELKSHRVIHRLENTTAVTEDNTSTN